MKPNNREQIIQVLKRLLVSELVNSIAIDPNDIDPDTSLFAVGVDSLNIIQFIIGIEEFYSITFDDEDIDMEKFETLNLIADIIERSKND